MNVIVKKATYRTRCQFSKKIIEKGTYISRFNHNQYNCFVENISNILSNLPNDIIELIIKKTNYENYINLWGIMQYTNWSLNLSEYYYESSEYGSESDDDINYDSFG